jgi:hypothetical protein
LCEPQRLEREVYCSVADRSDFEVEVCSLRHKINIIRFLDHYVIMSSTQTNLSTITTIDYVDLRSVADRVNFVQGLAEYNDLRNVRIIFSPTSRLELQNEYSSTKWDRVKKWLLNSPPKPQNDESWIKNALYAFLKLQKEDSPQEFDEFALNWTILHAAAHFMDDHLVDFLVEWESKNSIPSSHDIHSMQDSKCHIPLDIAMLHYDSSKATNSLYFKLIPSKQLTENYIEECIQSLLSYKKFQLGKFSVLQGIVLAELAINTNSATVIALIVVAASMLLAIVFDTFFVRPRIGQPDVFLVIPSIDASFTFYLIVILIVKFVVFFEAVDYSLAFLGVGMLLDDVSSMIEALPMVVQTYGRRRIFPLLNDEDESTDRWSTCKTFAARFIRCFLFPVETFGYFTSLILSWIIFLPLARFLNLLIMHILGRNQWLDKILSKHKNECPDKESTQFILNQVSLIWCVVLSIDIVFTSLAIWFGMYSDLPVVATHIAHPFVI